MEEEVHSPGVRDGPRTREDNLSIQALLDTGCLVGDCMSRR
jgi:hypothetical protein